MDSTPVAAAKSDEDLSTDEELNRLFADVLLEDNVERDDRKTAEPIRSVRVVT